MPRPHRRCRGGRVTPKGTRPGERGRERSPAGTPTQDPPLEQELLDDAADVAAECVELDEAEVWASSAQILFRPVGPSGVVVMPASRALAAARACPDRGAAAVVAASISAYGPSRERRRAARLLEELIGSGEPLPGWIGEIGDVTPRRAALLTDDWGDERSVWIDFERSDGEVRGLGVSVNGSQGAYACHFVYGPWIEAIEGPFAKQPHAVMRCCGRWGWPTLGRLSRPRCSGGTGPTSATTTRTDGTTSCGLWSATGSLCCPTGEREPPGR